MNTAPTDRPTGIEVQAAREALGMTLEGLATYLHVGPRTVRSWEQGRSPVPARVRDELATLTDRTDRAVNALHAAAAGGQDVTAWRDEAAFTSATAAAGLDVPAGAGARWWRHVAYRATAGTPARITYPTQDHEEQDS